MRLLISGSWVRAPRWAKFFLFCYCNLPLQNHLDKQLTMVHLRLKKRSYRNPMLTCSISFSAASSSHLACNDHQRSNYLTCPWLTSLPHNHPCSLKRALSEVATSNSFQKCPSVTGNRTRACWVRASYPNH
jgi:hypothetical protein